MSSAQPADITGAPGESAPALNGSLTCPTCGESSPSGELLCPKDGSALVDLFAGGATLMRTPTVAEDPLVGKQVGDYQVKKVIGAGGMGLVYEAVQPVIGKRVAIKVLRPELASSDEQMHRLLSEARAANAIGHRGIIDIFAFGQLPDGRHYLIMEYLRGRSLDEYLSQRQPLSEREALPILEEILNALGAAHAAGVVHRDLKPSNVFLVHQSGGTPYVKLLDFGLAKVAPVPHGETPQTRTDMVVGTPEYMAPEQARGQSVGPATDLYALGVLAYQVVTGKIPFGGESAVDILFKHVQSRPAPPSVTVPGLHRAFEAVIMRLLAKRPEDRFASAEEARLAFRSALEQPATATPPASLRASVAPAVAEDSVATPPEKSPVAVPSWKPRLIWMGAMAAVATLASAGTLFIHRDAPAPVVVTVPAPLPNVAANVAAKVEDKVDALPVKHEAAAVVSAEQRVEQPPAKIVQARMSASKSDGAPTAAAMLARAGRLETSLHESAARAGQDPDPTAQLLLDSARKKIRQAKDVSGRRDASKFLDEWEAKYLPR